MTDQLSSQQEREYVEARWINVRNDGTLKHPIPVLNEVEVKIPFAEWDAGWHAAFIYTKERERQIAEARKAVELLQGILRDPLAQHYEEDAEIYRGIAVREQSRLADLKRGMK